MRMHCSARKILRLLIAITLVLGIMFNNAFAVDEIMILKLLQQVHLRILLIFN